MLNKEDLPKTIEECHELLQRYSKLSETLQLQITDLMEQTKEAQEMVRKVLEANQRLIEREYPGDSMLN